MASSRGGDVDKKVGDRDGDGGGDSYRDAVAAAARWELVVCQELAVESKFAFKASLILIMLHLPLTDAANTVV